MIQSSHPAARPDLLAVLCPLVWAAGAALSHRVGLWPGIGGAAVLLGVLAAIIRPEPLSKQLRITVAGVAAGALGTAVMIVATYGLYPPLAQLSPALAAETGVLYAFFGPVTGLKLALFLPLVVVSEELVWRGMVQNAIVRRLGPLAGLAAVTAVYALAHAPTGSILLTLLAGVCGLFWSVLALSTRSLVPGLICHLAWDVVVMGLYPLADPAR